MRSPLALIRRGKHEERDISPWTLDDYLSFFSWQGNTYGIPFFTTTMPTNQEEPIPADFAGLIAGAYKRNAVIAACIFARMMVFKEARFKFRRHAAGSPAALFGTSALAPLERPWPGATTCDLLARAIVDADLAGNFYAYRKLGSDTIKRLRPDWVTIVLGSPYTNVFVPGDPDLEVVGYVYKPGGPPSDAEPRFFRTDEVAHFAPIPDPDASFRGMSWITPVIREAMADGAATSHKLRFFENGATMNQAVTMPQMSVEKFNEAVQSFRDQHEGVANAYRTLFLAGGADIKPIGTDLRQLDFSVSQGMGEARVAAAAGVPAVIVGLKPGLDASTYSNFGQARRRFADGTLRPLWNDIAGSLETIVPPPDNGSELWYDDSQIAFVQEDKKDAAEAAQTKAAAISSLVTAGFNADDVVAAVAPEWAGMLTHSGLFSVQLQPPGQNQPPDVAVPALNGAAAARELVAALIERDERS